MLDNSTNKCIHKNCYNVSDLKLDKNISYFENLREVVRCSVKSNLRKLRDPVNPDSWEEHQVNVD